MQTEAERLLQTVRADPALRARAARRLGVTEKIGLAAELVAAYVGVRVRVRRVPLASLLARLRSGVVDSGIPAGQAAAEHVQAVRLGRAVRKALAHVPGDTRCLTQSLVLTTLLARRGIGSTMMLAAATGDEFRAHAWVEHGGVPVLPAEGPSFVRLVAL
jgi:hypothetical protein